MNQPLQEADVKSIGDLLVSAATGIITANTQSGKKNASQKYSYSSIARASSKLLAIFPILSSKTVSTETIHIVSKYIEQKACQMFMMALQAANIDNAESGIEYLSHYHQNLDIGGDTVKAVVNLMDDWVNAYKRGYNEGSIFSMNTTKDYDYLYESDADLEISAADIKDIINLMKTNEQLEFYDTELNPLSINDYMISESSGSYHVNVKRYNNNILLEDIASLSENRVDDRMIDHDYILNSGYFDTDCPRYAGEPGYDRCDVYSSYDGSGYNYTKNGREQEKRDARNHRLDAQRNADRIQARKDKNKAEAERNRDKKAAEKAEQRRAENERRSKISSGINVSIFKDQDIKKMNDALPSILKVKFYHSENASVVTEFIIGVKSTIIPVETTEILRRIMNDNKDGKKFLKFIRAITGELKASDTIFGLAQIKDDVMSTRKKGAHGDTWELLKNRAALAKKQLARGQRNDFSAITTVLISKADAESLYIEENLDITDPINARHFMNSYNILAFAIADDSTESLKILFDDGSKFWDEISYRMLERETQTEYKKLVNLMAASR